MKRLIIPVTIVLLLGAGTDMERPFERRATHMTQVFSREILGAICLTNDMTASRLKLTEGQRTQLDLHVISEWLRLQDMVSRIRFETAEAQRNFKVKFWYNNDKLLSVLTDEQRIQWAMTPELGAR